MVVIIAIKISLKNKKSGKSFEIETKSFIPILVIEILRF